MGTVKIRHNDFKEPMEEMVRKIFGDKAELLTKDGDSGEKVLYVIGDGVSSHSIDDLEKIEWVLSAEYIR